MGFTEKTCLGRFANNTGSDQPAHPCRLISAFVIRFLESIISKLATSEMSIFWLVSVAEETGLSLALSETPKTGFLATRPISYLSFSLTIFSNAGVHFSALAFSSSYLNTSFSTSEDNIEDLT